MAFVQPCYFQLHCIAMCTPHFCFMPQFKILSGVNDILCDCHMVLACLGVKIELIAHRAVSAQSRPCLNWGLYRPWLHSSIKNCLSSSSFAADHQVNDLALQATWHGVGRDHVFSALIFELLINMLQPCMH